MKKKIASFVVLLLVVICAYHYKLISYGLSQAKGQLTVLMEAVPIEEALESETFPDSLKSKLRLVGDIRRFGIDSLKLRNTKNYTTVFNQNGKPILWVVVASEKYRLKAIEWEFPVIGSFPYKGFFDRERLKEEKASLDANGLDTHVNEVAGWSTLGWFRDPILSSMLLRPEGSLANLIIHEMTHATLFVPGNSVFNENLATFIADVGARRYIKNKYGEDSPEMLDYLGFTTDRKKLAEHMLRGAKRLDSLYSALEGINPKEKDEMKEQLISQIFQQTDSIEFRDTLLFSKFSKLDSFPNNAYFIGFKTYREQQNVFEEEFKEKFGSDFERYFAYLKSKYQ